MLDVTIYRVGGFVRDQLLGLSANDHDWVVVGGTKEGMLSAGYQQVGKDFPVFLHPETRDEYALARTERKSAPGYGGFVVHATPEVTIEQDLFRRDFTINAMAQSGDGKLIDPYGGKADLRAGILRHVSLHFAEDPVRILRGARFAARYDFELAPETMELMRDMVNSGEVNALTPERVWQELSRALMTPHPSKFFTVLRQCGALKKILPEVDALFGVPQPAQHHPEIDTGVHVMMVIDETAAQNHSLPVRFAALVHDLGKGVTPKELLPQHINHEMRGLDLLRPLCARLGVPSECCDLGMLASRYHTHIHRIKCLRASTIADLLQNCDALRRPRRFVELLQVAAADARGRLHHENDDYSEADYAQSALAVFQAVNAGELAKQIGKQPIYERIRIARINALKNFIAERRLTEQSLLGLSTN